MILISKGAGGVVAFIWFVSILAGDKVCDALFGPNTSNGRHNLTGEWLAAALTLVFALLLRLDHETAVNPQTGQQIVIHSSHSLFFIPVIVWPAIFFVLGIAVSFK
jgi:hypothetical protein